MTHVPLAGSSAVDLARHGLRGTLGPGPLPIDLVVEVERTALYRFALAYKHIRASLIPECRAGNM